ncbi:MAG: N-acetyl-gamma-glutamyl-phosphate reductase [Clostridia bacterium]|nr:N-acetyl-gamma-glutamyl-phosphate reductase [Clostridia bacterium]
MKLFIDGSAGTTGLRIRERLNARPEFELLTLPDEKRKDPAAKKEIYAAADFVITCLPDAAAIEAADLAEEVRETHPVRLLDTSTAHRTSPGWAYGFPELSEGMRADVRAADRLAVPGCHASGFIALVRPLVKNGLISPETALSCFSLTGYSGGGNKMIAEYENDSRSPLFDAPRQYAMGQSHKHLKEMVGVSGMKTVPVFCPVVGDFYSGMQVSVPLFKKDLLKGGVEDIKEIYRSLYASDVVSFREEAGEDGFLAANALSGKDSMMISVAGNEERILLLAVYDNLGKGASGAAVQCLNLMCGFDETLGLEL